MWSNAKKFVGGALAALVAAALALAVAAVPAEALDWSAVISGVGTYSFDITPGYAVPSLLFDAPESGVYCFEFSWDEGDLDFVNSSVACGYDSEGNKVDVIAEPLYRLIGGGVDTDDTSTVVIYQLEGAAYYEVYLGYWGYATSTIEVTVTKVGTDAEDEDFVPVWRLYNPYSGEHHFTTSTVEYEALVSLGWTGEGICWLAPEESSTPVYRLYNQWSGDHHYTTDATEYAALLALGWEDEGIGWYSSGSGTAVYRLYNPFVTSYYHHYTVDSNEYATLLTLGWTDEQVGWYGL